MRFGRLSPNKTELASAHAHTFGVRLAQPVLNRQSVAFTPGLYRNDTLGDCTVVSIANMINAKSALNGYQTYIDSDKVVEFFKEAAGNPPDLTTVDGLVYLDVINRQAQLGFDTGHDRLYGLPGTVGLSRNELALGMEAFGSVGLGVTLRDRDVQTTSSYSTLDAGPSDGNVIGGHAIIGWDYTGLGDTDIVRIGTWGYWQMVTWRWIDARLEEAHATNWPQLLGSCA